jgi:TDG/mug DNA glycosylase family protein
VFHVKQHPELPPTQKQLALAHRRKLRDVIAPDLRILFCGINPGLYSAAAGHHFARPGNRFWSTLHRAGLTPRVLNPWEDEELLELGLGVTNIVARATARAELLEPEELVDGARVLRGKVRRYRPNILAIVGLGAYRVAFAKPKARQGLQFEALERTHVWLLPNPSGLNAHHQPPELARLFADLRKFSDQLEK